MPIYESLIIYILSCWISKTFFGIWNQSNLNHSNFNFTVTFCEPHVVR